MRVIFAETLGKNGTSIDESTTVEIDADASQAFFNDRWRMSEDILSNGAAACIGNCPTRIVFTQKSRIRKLVGS